MTDVRQWMPLHIGVYLKNTRRLTTEQHGAYLLLIMEYWQQQEPLPDDDDDLASVTGLATERWIEIRPKLERYFIVEGGVWRHERIDREIEEATKKLKEKSERMQQVRDARAAKRSAQETSKEADARTTTHTVAESATESVTVSATHLPSPSPISPNGDIPPLIPPDGGKPPDQKKPKRQRRSALPPDFPSQDDLNKAGKYWSENGRSDLSVQQEALEFRAHHEGKGTLAASWPATWRTWYLRALKFAKPRRMADARGSPAGSDMSKWGRGAGL